MEPQPPVRQQVLPPAPTSFIDRAREVAEVEQLLSRTRLVTLTGTAGCGKTRLARQLAESLALRFEHGVCWVHLAPITHASFVPYVLATGLGLAAASPTPIIEALISYLHPRQHLLILDHCDQLIPGVRRLAHQLIQACPRLQLLATSRVALSIPEGVSWLIPSLDVPPTTPDREPGASLSESAASYPAVRLFVDRARAANPAFALTSHNTAQVIDLCRHLDGIPLAIELAAPRFAILPEAERNSRINELVRLIASDPQHPLSRPQTLQATVDWSHDLLTEAEKVCFRRLSTFTGDFSLEAAQDVCAGDPIAREAVPHHLQTLAALGLARRYPTTESPRYDLPVTLRHYAANRLAEAAETDGIHHRRTDLFLTLVKAAAGHLRGPDEQRWAAVLTGELNNLRGTLSWATAPAARPRGAADEARIHKGLSLAAFLTNYWTRRGLLHESRAWLIQALAAAPAGDNSYERARALLTLGLLYLLQANTAAARGPIEESATSDSLLNDGRMHARLKYGLGQVDRLDGMFDTARTHFTQCIELARRADDHWCVALGCMGLGGAFRDTGDYTAAREILEEGARIAGESGDPWLIARLGSLRGDIARLEGDTQTAIHHYMRSLALETERGDIIGAASRYYKLALIARDTGDLRASLQHMRQSLELRRDLGDPRLIAESLVGFASLALVRGRPSRAARLLAMALAILNRIGVQVDMVARREADTVRAALSEAEWSAAWAVAPATTLDAAVAYALETDHETATVPAVLTRPPATPELDATVRLLTFGSPSVFRGETRLSDRTWRNSKTAEILFYILCYPRRTREQIGVEFWPDATATQLRRSFHAALHRLRDALGNRDWIREQGGVYDCPRTSDLWWDVDAFMDHLSAAGQGGSPPSPESLRRLEAAVALYQDDFLTTISAGWAEHPRRDLRRRFLDALLTLGDASLAAGELARAIGYYQRAVDRDMVLESAHRGLMRAYARQGERNRALRHYEVLQAYMRRELGAQPGPETRALAARLQAGETI